MHSILFAIVSATNDVSSRDQRLRTVRIACEPGEGPWRYLCGQVPHAAVPVPRAAKHDGGYTYEQKRSVAIWMLFDGLEDVLVRGSLLNPNSSYRPLEVFVVRIWDSAEGMHDGWWFAEIARMLPNLAGLGVLKVEVERGCECPCRFVTSGKLSTYADHNGRA